MKAMYLKLKWCSKVLVVNVSEFFKEIQDLRADTNNEEDSDSTFESHYVSPSIPKDQISKFSFLKFSFPSRSRLRTIAKLLQKNGKWKIL